jgi:hypothetical protein
MQSANKLWEKTDKFVHKLRTNLKKLKVMHLIYLLKIAGNR